MFAESLLETSWAERERRSWTTITSFGLQAVIIGLLLLVPLLTTVGLPLARTVSTPITSWRRDPGPAPHVQSGGRTRGVRIIPYSGSIMQPRAIPTGIATGNDTTEVATGSGEGPDIGPYIGSGPGLPMAIVGTRPVMPVAAKPIEKVFRRSEILEGSLIRKVEPKYPPLAIAARIQGPVVLAAVISKEGTIENLRLVNGHPMLVPAAIEAVSQWRYRPYSLNGDVIEVDTQITVNFVLGR